MPSNQKDDFQAKFGADTSEFDKALNKLEKDTKKTMESVTTVTNTAAVAFTGLAAGIALTTAAFAKYEKGLIAVQKTSNLSDEETEKLGDELLALSKKAPLAIDSLLEISEAAGQLGIVGRKNILKFTDTVAKLEATTNLQGEEAAKTLARILNVTGESIGNVDKLGSAFVQLGNSVAASEAEIAAIAGEVAKSTAIFNIGAANAVGLGASMAELGINAERGGSVVGRAFSEIKTGIDSGGESLVALSKATGIAAEDLKGAFAEDATGVFVKFLGSVKEVVESGGDATAFLDSFGLKGAGVSKVLAPLSLRIDSLTKNLEASGKEFENATALEAEFAKASTSVSAQLKVVGNTFEAAAITLGEKFAPTVLNVSKAVAGLVNWFASLDDETISFITRAGLAVTAVAAVTLGIGLATKAVLALRLAFILLKASNPLLLVASGIAALGIAVATYLATAPEEIEKGNKKILENARASSQKLFEEQTAANKKAIGEVKRLKAEKQKILSGADDEIIKKDKKAAFKQLAIEKAKLELSALKNEAASSELIQLKTDEILDLETLQSLSNENAKISADENRTALDLIEREKNKDLIKQTRSHLRKTLEAQQENDRDIYIEIGDFEERTRRLINKSFDAKEKDQKKSLEDIDRQLNDISQKGSYPSRYRSLDNALVLEGDRTAEFYADELVKHQGFLDAYANQGGDAGGDTGGGGGSGSGGGDTGGGGGTTETIQSDFYLAGSSCPNGYSRVPSTNNPNIFVCVEDCPSGYTRVGFSKCEGTRQSATSQSAAPQISQSTTQPSLSTTRAAASEAQPEVNNNSGSSEIVITIKPDQLTRFVSAEQRKQTDLGISAK